MSGEELQQSLLNLIDIINFKWTPKHIKTLRTQDHEEFMYQESLISQGYVQVCLLLLEHSQDEQTRNSVFQYTRDMIENKAGVHFESISDSFTQAKGLDLILKNLQSEYLRLEVLLTMKAMI